MKKISINNIIKFRNRPEKNQKAFLNSLIAKSETKTEGGGNYWVRSLSALSNSIKYNNHEPIKEKIDEILELYSPDLTNQTKIMYDRNLNILYNYEDFDFSNWLPNDHEILSKSKNKSIIYLNSVPVQITPSQIFSFENEEKTYVGAIWFVAKLDGYKTSELGMFAEALFIYLSNNFKNKYEVSNKHCIVVDVLGKFELNYQNLIDNEVVSILGSTLKSIEKKM